MLLGRTDQYKGVVFVRLREDHVDAFHSVHSHLDIDANLLQVLYKHFLVHRVVLYQKHLVALVAHSLLDLLVAGLLVLHHLLCR